ncbi:MAG: glycosyltransferase family 2 protein [Ignavibacteriae bacterium]|nr:glycosyltransferase family 2 protein [Ignavibacteriota bacterium]
MKSETIAAIVVTYNRLSLLKETVAGLLSQTRLPDAIIIVNNSCTDGTLEWLESLQNITIITQGNIGGAGGFATGLEYCFKHGFDWIWCMDDDVVAMPDCLEKMLNFSSDSLIRAPFRFESGNSALPQDTLEFNFTNPFKSLWKRMFTAKDIENVTSVSAEGLTFEGPIVNRKVIDSIGLPDAGFFIFADDSDFFIRAHKHGYTGEIILSSRMQRMIPYTLRKSAPWKQYYELRNIIILDMRYGNLPVKLIRPVYYFFKMLAATGNNSERLHILKGFVHGILQKTGKL